MLKFLLLKRLLPDGTSIVSATGYSLRHMFSMREMIGVSNGKFWIEAQKEPAERKRDAG